MADMQLLKAEDISIEKAIETLSHIAELELTSTLKDVSLLVPEENETVVMKTVRWLHAKNAERMREIVRENLRVVLGHLKHFYSTANDRLSTKESFEGIKTIMLLVDEATENVDRYARVFLGSQQNGVRQTKEFIRLCSFYRKKIVPIFSDQKLSSWVTGLTASQLFSKMIASREMQEGRLLLEAEKMSRDLDYELAILKQPRGEKFLSPQLVRDLQLYSDVSEGIRPKEGGLEHELSSLSHAQLTTEVSFLLKNSYAYIDAFFRSAHLCQSQPLVRAVYSPCIALFAASLYSMYKTPTAKGLIEYFDDFRYLVHQFIYLPEFQKLLAYPPNEENSWQFRSLRLAEEWSSRILSGVPISREMSRSLQSIFHQAIEKFGTFKTSEDTLSIRLSEMVRTLFLFIGERRESASGLTMRKVREKKWSFFEPILSESLPTHVCNICYGQRSIPLVRMPSPTFQEFVNRAQLSEIFQVKLHQKSDASRILFLNFQDPEDWKEQARCTSIDELANRQQSHQQFCTLCLPKNGAFYNQEGVYDSASSIRTFVTLLRDNLMSALQNASSLPEAEDWNSFLEKMISSVQTIVFQEKHTLSKSLRQIFIDVVQTLLILKLIDSWQPDVVVFSCKDGLDLSLSAVGELFGIVSWLNDRSVSEEEMMWLRAVLFGLPLVQRSRPIFQDRCQRLIANISALENAKSKTELFQMLEPLFPKGTLRVNLKPNFDR